MPRRPPSPRFFFFNDTATTEIYTLSLHDALPISHVKSAWGSPRPPLSSCWNSSSRSPRSRPASTMAALKPIVFAPYHSATRDRKSTRLNSSHLVISYAVFCLKKKKKTHKDYVHTV